MRLLQIVSLAALMSGLFSSLLHAQDYGIEVEVVSEDIMLVGALGITDLSGYSCSRVYITMENENDFLSSISGDANNPSYVNATTNFTTPSSEAPRPTASTACSSTSIGTSPTTAGSPSVWKARPMPWPVKRQ